MCRPTASAPSFTIRTNTKAIGATTSSRSSRSGAATSCRTILPELNGDGEPTTWPA